MSWEDKAKTLVAELAEVCASGEALGSMSVTVYDTAWVSMISMTVDDEETWLFPNSYSIVLDQQLPDGGWQSYASDIDGILNFMAALLSLCYHRKRPYRNASYPKDTDLRIERVVAFLSAKLQQWDPEYCDHVGFEVLVPSLLDLLNQEDIHFSFPRLAELIKRNSEKLAKFDPQILYSLRQTTLVHSLEGLIGKINFDCVRH